MNNQPHIYTTEVNGKTFTFETGKLAAQAGGALTLRLGDTVVLATATMGNEPRMGIDFFPLSVDYEERMYAGGRIPGSFFRREGRPTEEAILTARLRCAPCSPKTSAMMSRSSSTPYLLMARTQSTSWR
jgi:polyribonucleotide nucleotidyltransferase